MARMVHLNGPNGLSRSSSKKNNRNFIPSHSTSIILDPGKWERAMTTIRETSNLLNGLKAMTATIAIATLLNRASYFHHLIRKAGYRPDQPRAPRGQSDGGQWVDEGNSDGSSRTLISSNSNTPSKIPEERPPTARERNSIAVRAARFLVATSSPLIIAHTAKWLSDYANDRIVAYLEPPRTLKNCSLQPMCPNRVMIYIMSSSKRRRGRTDS